MDATRIDLNAPAFGLGAQKPEDLEIKTEEAAVQPSVEEPTVEVREEEEVAETSEEETKVPYSRFKKYHNLAAEKEKEAEYWRGIAEGIKPAATVELSNDVPSYWLELYGDSDASKNAWKFQQEQNERLKAEAKDEAIQAVRAAQSEEVVRTAENEDALDEHLEDVSVIAGRNLTEKEQSEILDIVDDYTPKDAEGNYVGAIIAPDKAWEIYELKQQALNGPKKKSRDVVASLTGSQSQGQPEGDKQEQDKNWNPFDWNSWQKRLPN